MSKYKNILKDEMAGYHTQLHKMKNNDMNAILRIKKRKKI